MILTRKVTGALAQHQTICIVLLLAIFGSPAHCFADDVSVGQSVYLFHLVRNISLDSASTKYCAPASDGYRDYIDWLGRKANYQYEGKPWIAFEVGYNFLTNK